MTYNRVVIYGGSGRIGSAFGRDLLSTGSEVVIVDRDEPSIERHLDGAQYTAADLTRPSAEVRAAVGGADLVIIALAASLIDPAYDSIAGAVRPGALVVDTMSFKKLVPAKLKSLGYEVKSVNFLGIDPMAGPERSLRGIPALHVPYEGFCNDDATEEFLAWMNAAGSPTHTFALAGHAAVVTAQQTLTHAAMIAYGNSLVTDPTSADGGTLDYLAARTKAIGAHVYWEIQVDNADGHEVRSRLLQALEQASGATRAGTIALAFRKVLDSYDIDLAEALKYATPPFKLMVRESDRTSSQAGDQGEAEALIHGLDLLNTSIGSGDVRLLTADLNAFYNELGPRAAELSAGWTQQVDSLRDEAPKLTV